MTKISQIVYTRPQKEDILRTLEEILQKFNQAKTVEEFLEVHRYYKEQVNEIKAMGTIAAIRFTQDTRDEFYAAEQDYFDEIMPVVATKIAEISKCYVNSKFVGELKQIFPAVLFTNLQMEIDAQRPELVDLSVEQNKLTTRYTKLMSGIVIDFNGEKLPMSGIVKYFTNPDREIRRQAMVAYGQAVEDNKVELDEIYDKLVKIRTEMGQKIGYQNFSPLGYLKMQRNCYGKEQIAKFRQNVKKHLVPLANKIRQKVQSQMGWQTQYVYDDKVFTQKEPKPIGTPEEIFKNGSKMYHEMSEETGKLFDLMVESEAFDALSRPGKWGGGYCTQLEKYKLPFILSNFNGSAGDIEVLTHEFGHAYEAFKAFEIDTDFLSSYSMETAEVHSMSMEFLTYKWMPLFFGENVEEFKFYHIASSLTFIPYGTIVDYFQQVCYDNPNMTPAQRNQTFLDMEKEFLPWMTCDTIPAFENGRRWQRQAHIYESPFYYIDYCLAQFMALQFLALSQKDFDAAMKKYTKFLSLGGTKSFVDLVSDSGLLSPFEEESFELVVNTVQNILKI